MFPIARSTLSFLEISDYWSREIQPPVSKSELLCLLEQAWWRGEIRGDSMLTRLELLKRMFKSIQARNDWRIVFTVGAEYESPSETLPDGSVVVCVRHQIHLPSGDTDTWDEGDCRDAFHDLAQTSSRESYPEMVTAFAFFELTYGEFMRWLASQSDHWPKPTFWRPSVQLKAAPRGRRAAYNWPRVKELLREHVLQHGPIQSHKELLQKCEDFASELHPEKKTPDDKTIREAIKTHELDVTAGIIPGE